MMKRLLEILGINSENPQQEELIQKLRDEAVQEKAKDELSSSAEEGISSTLYAIRQKRQQPLHLETKRQTDGLAIWGIGFACALAFVFFFLPTSEKKAPTLSGSIDSAATPVKDQGTNTLQWANGLLALDTQFPKFESLSLPDKPWLKSLDANVLVSANPIGPIASMYEELANPTLPEFEIPTLTVPAMNLYMEEGKRIRNDLQNGFGFVAESLWFIDIEIEG